MQPGVVFPSLRNQVFLFATFGVTYRDTPKNSACACDRILRGIAQPDDCTLYGTACTPNIRLVHVMVSHEGACRIWHQYHNYRKVVSSSSCLVPSVNSPSTLTVMRSSPGERVHFPILLTRFVSPFN